MIIEDELIIAEDLRIKLIELGYHPTGIAVSYHEAIAHVQSEAIDLALVDISIHGSKDGIEVAKTLKSLYKIPVVFITSHADKKTVERAKPVKPEGYLVKPFNTQDLYTAIEIAQSNFQTSSENAHNSEDDEEPEFIFLKVDSRTVKVVVSQIAWIKSMGNYIEVVLNVNKKYVVRSTLKEILIQLPSKTFYQIHKSYIANTNFIESIEYRKVVVNNQQLPISRSAISDLKKKMGIA